MRSRRTSVAALALALLLGAGCAAGRPERADTIAGELPSTPTAAAAVAAPAPTAGRALDQERVEAALLTAVDLPRGWSVQPAGRPPAEGDGVTGPAACVALFEQVGGIEPAARADGVYVAGPLGPILNQNVSSFEQGAAHRLRGVTEAFSSCPRFASTDGDGVVTEFTTAPLSFPNVGDRTLAVRLRGTTQGLDLVFDVVYIAVGRNGISLVAGGLIPLEHADLTRLATAAVARLEIAAAV